METLAAGTPVQSGGGAAVSVSQAAAGLHAQIGPNSVVQLSNALYALAPDLAHTIFARAHAEPLLTAPPSVMIDERIPKALFDALYEAVGPLAARAIAEDAGRRTADYIIENRIPRFAQILLGALPRRLAVPILLRAIQRAAWTFVGSGRCGVNMRPAVITIANNPLTMPGCAWHCAVFSRLFQQLIDENTLVQHTACCKAGEPHCSFAIIFNQRGAR